MGVRIKSLRFFENLMASKHPGFVSSSADIYGSGGSGSVSAYNCIASASLVATDSKWVLMSQRVSSTFIRVRLFKISTRQGPQ
jgi:hypothetical protein